MFKFTLPAPVAVEVEGQTVYVHALTAGQYAELLNAIDAFKKKGESHKADFELLRLSVKDADGKPVFGSSEEAMAVPLAVAGTLLPVCLKANGLGEHDAKKAASATTPHA